MKLEEITLWRSSSTGTGTGTGTLSSADRRHNASQLSKKLRSTLTTLLRSLIPTALAPPRSLGRRVVTGTLFGHRNGHVTFSVQDHPRSDPVLLIELATSTSALVKEMSSGLVRIALVQCNSSSTSTVVVWTMYCNGNKCTGYAMPRPCSDFHLHVLRTVQAVSVGAGVIPQFDGDLVYLRARFDRVVDGTRHSEAFYMLNPDGNGGPELCIFLLRASPGCGR